MHSTAGEATLSQDDLDMTEEKEEGAEKVVAMICFSLMQSPIVRRNTIPPS